MRALARPAAADARIRRLLGPLSAGRSGNVALIFALLLPAIVVTSLGAFELQQVMSDRKRTQDVADSAALMGASQLGVTPNGADQRAQSFAQAQLSDIAGYATVTVAASAGANNTMTVTVDTQRASFFGNLLPPGGFHTHVSSTAQGQNTAPLCVLGGGLTAAQMIHITGNSQLQAGSCLVHSNQALTVDPAASLLASISEASTLATGPITPAADVSAPNIPDPFASLNVNPATACPTGPGTPLNVGGGTSQTLASGIHAMPITVSGGSTLTLSPGDHYFCQTVTVSGGSTLTGTDVDLVFDNKATLSPSGSGTKITLAGRQSGPLAGFVIIADRTYTGAFTLMSDFITQLTGTVYVPTATLAVQGTAKSGSSTPWTVIDAQNFTVNGGAELVINANYAASNVPVPSGVGNQHAAGGAKLTQ